VGSLEVGREAYVWVLQRKSMISQRLKELDLGK
jgi:hypothetical protein